MSYRIVIPTAGIGSRLEKLTRYINKSLVSISNRPILSHLIDQFPGDCEFVIALGYKGSIVREFLQLAYPSRTFYFVDVDPYIGNGSGLGYSLLCCEQFLQEPFIFVSCDTLVKGNILPPDHNWIGSSHVENVNPYRTLSINNNYVDNIYEKNNCGASSTSAYIGLCGIKSYDEFWSSMNQGGSTAVNQGEVYGLRSLLENHPVKSYAFTWFDTGNLSALEIARATYRHPDSPNILEKQNEAIWFVDDLVVKYSDDKQFISNRVRRSEKLGRYIPQVIASTDHMYCYKKAEGVVLSKVITLPLFKTLLQYCSIFWQTVDVSSDELVIFYSKCRSFYYNKTIERVNLFYENFDKLDQCLPINDQPMPLLISLLEKVDWDEISKGLPGRFHGDFHFENILFDSSNKSFVLLDWRQDFSGDLEVGDIYYDLAKLLHGLIVSHELIASDSFHVEWNDDYIRYDLQRWHIHVECEQYLLYWCEANGFDFSKIRLLTALIYLNIAALHHYPYSFMLYALGKQMLYQELSKQ